ncbi:MAG TPA: STAUR_1299 family protein [Myxococcaceae bacterium]|jgi:hypothetical protein
MEEGVAALLARAFHRVGAPQANVEMARVREQEGGLSGLATSYELVLPAERAAEHLVNQVLPRLVYFLECRGARPPNCAGVFVSIFSGDQLYFVRAGDMVEELSRLSGLSLEQMVERYGH